LRCFLKIKTTKITKFIFFSKLTFNEITEKWKLIKRKTFCTQFDLYNILISLKFWRHQNKIWLLTSGGSGSKFFDQGWVGSIFCGSGWVSHLWLGFEFGKFPLKMSNFSIFCPSGQKKSLRAGSKSSQVKGRSAPYLLRVKVKLGSGQGPSLLLTMMQMKSWTPGSMIFPNKISWFWTIFRFFIR